MIVIGIDPGYDRLGWAVGQIQDRQLLNIKFGCIVPDNHLSYIKKLDQVQNELETILSTHNPDVAAIESVYFSVNKKTAIKVSEARGVIIGCLLRNNCEINEYNPLTIKMTVTGHGRADKKAVAKLVSLQTGISFTGVVDDAIDAVAILITHSILRGSKTIA